MKGATQADANTQLLKQTNARLDQFETLMLAICSKLGVKGVTTSRSVSPSNGKADDNYLRIKGKSSTDDEFDESPASTRSTSLSPKSTFSKHLSKGSNMNDQTRANLCQVYGRNRQLLMEAETIVLWAALHWTHYQLSVSFCEWRGGTHSGMLKEILASRAALHWRMQKV